MDQQARKSSLLLAGIFVWMMGPSLEIRAQEDTAEAKAFLEKVGVKRGLCVLLGDKASLSLPLAQHSEFTILVQSPNNQETLCRQADAAGLFGTRIYVQKGSFQRLHLADDLADAVIVGPSARGVPRSEVLRILRPGGKAWIGQETLVKPSPAGTDEWTHPYHGPDNNPRSNDQVVRRPYLTHFLAEPWYCPLGQMTVISGGRMFKVFGDRSSARPQEDLLNQLLAMNAYNGTILWRRDLSPGFMSHRNTLIATPHTLFLADDKSCKLIDPASGKVRDEIVVPADLSDGPVWKWMALDGDRLLALVGEKEPLEEPLRGDRIRGAGWPWWNYAKYRFGFGRTLLAIDTRSKKVLWHHREQEPIDGRAVGLKNGRVFYYSDGKFLGCLDAQTGRVIWKNDAPELLQAISTTGPAQHWMLGFASTAYMKCGDQALFFAGPQRSRIAAVSTKDGQVLWQRTPGNVQLVLHQDALFALGEGMVNSVKSSFKLDAQSGKVLATFPSRDRCTRATGNADSIFTRGGNGGSTSVFDVTAEQPHMGVLSPMRPACQDGVVTAHGYLFWGPWMCACDQTQIGVISLGPGKSFDYSAQATEAQNLEKYANADPADDKALAPKVEIDWLNYRKDNACSVLTGHTIPGTVRKRWEYQPPHRIVPTAPIAADDLVLFSGTDGTIRALDRNSGQPRWTAFTGGPMKYPPAVSPEGQVFVGSGDGWIYCLKGTTGRKLWRFRAAPQERIIPVYGTLSSTWPVGSGVLVNDGVVYAAAGIFNYDGTHVYALDAQTGQIRWQNNVSGHLSGGPVDSGVSVQSHLLLNRGAIYLAAGNRPTMVSYAVADGTCSPAGQGRGKHLFVRNNQVQATGFPLYWRPEDENYLTPMELETPAGVIAINTSRLALQAGPRPKANPSWTCDPYQELAAVAIGRNALLVTGVNRDRMGKVTAAGLCAVSLRNGRILWKEPLPEAPVAWGLALDRTGGIIVTLTGGRVIAFEGS